MDGGSKTNQEEKERGKGGREGGKINQSHHQSIGRSYDKGREYPYTRLGKEEKDLEIRPMIEFVSDISLPICALKK